MPPIKKENLMSEQESLKIFREICLEIDKLFRKKKYPRAACIDALLNMAAFAYLAKKIDEEEFMNGCKQIFNAVKSGLIENN